MRLNRDGRWGLALAAGLALMACVDSPSEPASAVDQNPLATSFDALAQEMATVDVERSEEFRWAALALRAGVMPSTFSITNNGQAEVYDAFVHAVKWAQPAQSMRPLTHRNLVAWRRNGDLLQMLLVGMATDSAPVLHPYSMRPAAPGGLTASPIAGATAAYFERSPSGGTTWLGIGGFAKIAEQAFSAACVENDPVRPSGVTCQRARFAVQLNVQFAKTPNRDSRVVDAASATRRIIAPLQSVAGVKLTFSCLAPTSTGCG
jgi:hypothetical protein